MDNPVNVLEVGCGTMKLRKLLDCDYIGLDFEPRFKPDVVADAHYLPFRDNTFDMVVTKNCLQHLSSYQKALSEIMRVVSKRIVLAERTWEKPTKVFVDENGVIRRRFNKADLMDALKNWGEVSFKLSEADSRVGLYLGEPY